MRLSSALLALTLILAPAGDVAAETFDVWLDGVRTEAAARGIAGPAVDEALARARPMDRVLELDRRQPEFTQTFWRYVGARVTPARIEQGRAYLAAYEPLLEQVWRQYGVPPRIVVALWGLESDYGAGQGDFPVVASVATLAYDSRRSAFFRKQLLALLELVHRGDVAANVVGSWAGAMGQPQFMPTTLRDYGVDYDGDGRRDLVGSLPDVFGSAANYLAASGWNHNASWGHEVLLPADFDYAQAGLDGERPLPEWAAMGVLQADGQPLGDRALPASVVLPAGARGPAFVVFQNYRTILKWNNSALYALAVGHLADRIAGGGPLAAMRPVDDPALSRSEVVEMQARLVQLGFEPGEVDGVAGDKTRSAVREFQKRASLPADGYPDPNLLQHLRAVQ